MPVFGQEAQNMRDNNIFQGHQPTCAIRSQQIIMRDYGIQIPQDELIDYAEAHGWYDASLGGTPTLFIGNLLEMCGIHTESSFGNSVRELLNELQAGHRVIVSVDADELLAEPGSPEWQFYNGIDNPNHALIVAGIYVNPNDPTEVKAILTDPGRGDCCIEYDLEHFVQAWSDSDFYMMHTTEAAPYQYNAETGTMEFSEFATDFILQEFPFRNEFADIWKMDSANEYPYYKDGHLTNFGDGISYDDFLYYFNNNMDMVDLFHSHHTIDETLDCYLEEIN